MRPTCVLACAGVLALAAARPAAADEAADLKRLVGRVLDAHGGEARLAGVRAYLERTRVTAPGSPASALARYVQLPDRTRLESEFEAGGQWVRCDLVYAGDGGWKHTHGQPAIDQRSPFAGRPDPLRYAGPRAWLRLRDPAYRVTALGEGKEGGRPAFGLAVKPPGGPEERLFFDRETALLIRAEQTVVYARDGKAVVEETVYAGYKAADGIPVARKVTKKRDGKATQQVEVVEFRLAEKWDARLFEKP